MSKPNFFLRTKLLPPRIVSEMLPRPRLTEKLQANINAPITLIAADAGCGKTTLISDFIRRSSRQAVWYQLDHTDADPFVFLGYIAHGIKNFAPHFGEKILPYLEKATDDLLRFPERAVDLLLNEILETIEQPFILVLDDYHHIGRETVVHQLVDRILQYSSDILHLIITTRDLPPLAITRRRIQSRALVINRVDLLFTDEEMRELFRQTLNVELNDAEIAEYRERTHGWITALQLIKQLAEQEIDTRSDKLSIDLGYILRQSEKDIFDYFAEEVFSRESNEIQHLLLRLSLLNSLPLDVCSRLFPDLRCSALLPELLQKNLFLTVAGEIKTGEVYRFHPLFRDFLQRRLRSEIGRVELERERQRMADFFFAENQWESALPFLLEAENYLKAAEIIAENGGEWLIGGAITTLDNFIGKIPPEFLDKFPRSLLHKAEIARLRGEVVKLSKLLPRASKLLAKNKDTVGEAEALHSLASLARRKGDCAAAFHYLEKAEKLAAEDSETFLKCANTRGLCFIEQGAWTSAENQFHRALELAEQQANKHYIRLVTHNLALPAGFRGDFSEALRWFKRIFSDSKTGELLPQEATGHLNVAQMYLYRGEFEETEKHLERALEICQIFNLKSLRGEIFEAYGNFYREKADFSHAGEFYERALKAYEDAGVDLTTRDYDEERAKFYLLRGDAIKASGLLENLLAARSQTNNQFGTKTVRLILCRARLAQGQIDGLVEEIKELIAFFRQQNLNYDEASASLLLAETHFALGSRQAMLPPLEKTLNLAARFDYEYLLRGAIQKNPHLFADQKVLEKLPPALRESVALGASQPARKEKNQVSASSFQSAAIDAQFSNITDLTVNMLGFIEIYRDPTKPFASDAWTTKRARDIFCFIAAGKNQRAEKDIIIDNFWGADELTTIEKNFHPTISHIRKALNSRQTFKQNFLIFRDGAYQLNPELVYSIDTENFENFINTAEKAKREKDIASFRRNLEAARALYRGEFMAGVYEDWVEEKRHYYLKQFMRILTALAKLEFSEKNWSGVLKFTDQILQTDPFREDIHRLTMKVFAAQGKSFAVREQYETVRNLLSKELGVAPAPETRRVFQQLLK